MTLDRYILFLQNVDGIGDGTIRKLILNNCFKNFSPRTLEEMLTFLKQNKSCFTKKTVIDNLTLNDLKKANERCNLLENQCASFGVKYISFFNEFYPPKFKMMANMKSCDFPVILFYLGNIHLLNAQKMCAIIGTRKPSHNAKSLCAAIAKKMSEKGYVVISGLAEGCDTIAHIGCIEADGKTIAIVGTGLDTTFPKSNKELQERIIKTGGLVISEYPIGFKGAAYSFVQRDRLQASLADIVIPIQTSLTGGTMHAAKACVEKYNNSLIVVSPSLVSDGDSSGNNHLIKEYFAKPINNLSDIEKL